MNTKLIFLVFILICFTSCEGFKILSVYNSTKENIKITAIQDNTCRQYYTFGVKDSLNSKLYTTTLAPDSSVDVSAQFTFMMFSSKIKERDLNITYLKIQTSNNTIEAKNKSDIINLISNENTKYNRKLDKTKRINNFKNWRTIIVRH